MKTNAKQQRTWGEAFRLYWSAKEGMLAKSLLRRFLVLAAGTFGIVGVVDEFFGGWLLGPIDDIPWMILVGIVLWRVNRYRKV